MKRTNKLYTAIVYILLMIAAISALFINYSPTTNIVYIRIMCTLTIAISVIGLLRLRKQQ